MARSPTTGDRLRTLLLSMALGLVVWFGLFFLNYGIVHELLGGQSDGVAGPVQRLLPGESSRDLVTLPLTLGVAVVIVHWRRRGPRRSEPEVRQRSSDTDALHVPAARFDQIVDRDASPGDEQ